MLSYLTLSYLTLSYLLLWYLILLEFEPGAFGTGLIACETAAMGFEPGAFGTGLVVCRWKWQRWGLNQGRLTLVCLSVG